MIHNSMVYRIHIVFNQYTHLFPIVLPAVNVVLTAAIEIQSVWCDEPSKSQLSFHTLKINSVEEKTSTNIVYCVYVCLQANKRTHKRVSKLLEDKEEKDFCLFNRVVVLSIFVNLRASFSIVYSFVFSNSFSTAHLCSFAIFE